VLGVKRRASDADACLRMGTVTVLVVGSIGLAQEVHLACRRRVGITVHGPVVGAADAVSATVDSVPDVILVDVDVPDGLAILTEVTGARPGLRVMAVATSSDPDLAGRALAAGAAGLVLRGGPAAALVDALRRSAAGELVLADAHLQALVSTIHARRGNEGARERLDRLTSREGEILGLLAEGLGTAEVAARLGLSAATVRAHVKSILGKLGVHSTIEAMRLAWRGGIEVPAAVPIGA